MKSLPTRVLAVSIGLLAALSPTMSLAAAVKLAEGTEIQFKLKEELASGRSKVGDEVRAEVARDVKGPNGELLIARGAPARGRVTESRGARTFGGRGRLDFTIETVKAVDGTDVRLRGSQTNKGRSGSTASVAVIAFVSVAGFLIRGKNVVLREGTEFRAFVDEDVNVRPNGASSGTSVASETKAKPGTKTSVFKLKSGDVIKGKIISLNDGVYRVETAVGVVSIDEENVISVTRAK